MEQTKNATYVFIENEANPSNKSLEILWTCSFLQTPFTVVRISDITKANKHIRELGFDFSIKTLPTVYHDSFLFTNKYSLFETISTEAHFINASYVAEKMKKGVHVVPYVNKCDDEVYDVDVTLDPHTIQSQGGLLRKEPLIDDYKIKVWNVIDKEYIWIDYRDFDDNYYGCE